MNQPIIDTRRAWIVTGMLFLFMVINFFDKLVMGLAAVPIMKELDLTPSQYGLVASSFYSLYAVSGVCFGLFVVQRLRSKWLLTLLVLIWSASQLPIAISSSLWVLVACRVVLGIGEGPGTPSAYHACYAWFPSEKRNLPTAIVLQGAGVGFMIGAPILTYVIASHGWRAAFLLCSLLGAAWVVGWLIVGRDGPIGEHVETHDDGLVPVSWARFWLDPTMLGNLAAGFAAYWVAGLSIAWLAPYLQLGLGYDQKTAGWLVSVIVGVQPPIILLISWMSHRLLQGGSSRVARGMVNGACILASGVALLLATQVGTGTVKILLLAAGFVLPQITFVLGPAIVGEIAPMRQRGQALLITYSVVTVAGFASPAVTGRLVEAAGTVIGYDHAFLVTSAVLIVGGLVGLLLLNPEATRRRFATPASAVRFARG